MSYLALPLAQSALSLALLLLVGIKGPRHGTVRSVFMLLLGALGLWGLIIFAMRSSTDTAAALFWERLLLPLGILIPALFGHFVVRFTGAKISSRFIFCAYLGFFITIPLFLGTDLLIVGMQVKSYGYAPVLANYMIFPLAFSLGLVTGALAILGRYIRRCRDSHSGARAKLIMTGGAIALGGIVFDLLPLLGLPLYPGFIIGNIILGVCTSMD